MLATESRITDDVNAVKLYGQLVGQAVQAMCFRGHDPDIGGMRIYRNGSRLLGSITCSKCGMIAGVDTSPMPNGIDVGGEAVAVHCKD